VKGFAATVLLLLFLGGTAAATDELTIEVERTTFQIRKAGRLLSQDELVGTELSIVDPSGPRQLIRIDRIVADPIDRSSEIKLYEIVRFDQTSGEWRNLCKPGPDGLALAFPLQGSWTQDGQHIKDSAFSLTCTSGAIGKCIRFGYRPWAEASNGESLWDYHQACTRMIRADYCGDGHSWTRDGVAIDVYDRLGIQRPDPSLGLRFEAAWGPDGAICINHPRLPELITTDELHGKCTRTIPVGPDLCRDPSASLEGGLILNRSGKP